MRLIVFLLVNTIAVFIAAYILPGVHVDSVITAFIVAILLGIINTIIRPILLLLTFPITLMTLGLFTLVINGLLVLLVTYFVKDFTVDNFLWAVGFSIIVSLVSWFLSKVATPATA
jgi:putative membrane protein